MDSEYLLSIARGILHKIDNGLIIGDKCVVDVTIHPKLNLPVKIRMFDKKYSVEICGQMTELCSEFDSNEQWSFVRTISSIHLNGLQDNLLSHNNRHCVHKEMSLFVYLCDVLCIPTYTQSRQTVIKGVDAVQTNVLLPICLIERATDVFAVYDWSFAEHFDFTLWQCVTHSPALVNNKRDTISLILLHVLHALADVQKTGLMLKEIVTNHFFVDNKCWVMFDLLQCILSQKKDRQNFDELDMKDVLEEKNWEKFDDLAIWDATKLWCDWKMDNYDYLLYLNKLSGREFGVPHNHPIVPWVCNFSMREGGWRDLSVTKYRLTKGDQQLDQAYGHSGVKHHISELLSDIAYYVYKARVTDKDTLCSHVRSGWVAEEYPSTMRRIYDWSPDECIPEFYTDPALFKSIHEDLGDIELPSWCSNAAEFISWHRGMLECDWVSQRLHHWIDLVFGYKLVGASALSSKNVHLSLVDKHVQLRDHGPVQLFHKPHPQRKHRSGEKEEYTVEDSVSMSLQALSDAFSQPANTVQSISTVDIEQVTQELREKLGESVCPDYLDHVNQIGLLLLQILIPKTSHIYSTITGKGQLDILKKLFIKERHLLPRFVVILLERLLFCGPKISVTKCRQLLCWSIVQPVHTVLPLGQHVYLLHSCCAQVYRIRTHTVHFKYLSVQGNVKALATLQSFYQQMVHRVECALTDLLHCCDCSAVHLFAVLVCELIADPWTAVAAASTLIIPIATALGKEEASRIFGPKLLALYSPSAAYCRRHLKLYHRTFLLQLIVAFGTHYFLNHFVGALVEACTPHRDSLAMGNEDYLMSLLVPEASENARKVEGQNVLGTSLDSDLEENMEGINKDNGRNSSFDLAGNEQNSGHVHISEVARDSILWLCDRCGPVLTAQYISKNLLRMLCIGPSDSSQMLTHCLIHIANIYGDAFIWGHYISFCADVVNQASKRLTVPVQNALIACIMLCDVLLPHLTDKQLIENLQDPIVDGILFPSVRIVSSMRDTFVEVHTRSMCACRLARLLGRLAIRIGVENVKRLLAAPLQRFFCVYDNLYQMDSAGRAVVWRVPVENWADCVILQLQQTFTPHLAAYLYKTFAAFCGRRYVSLCLANSELVENIVDQLGSDDSPSPTAEFLVSYSHFTSGNRLSGSLPVSNEQDNSNQERTSGSTRELCGNWLAYWKSRIGQDGPIDLSINQVPLQSFVGHTSPVRRIRLMENENSFLSASLDKTVKLWSLRSQGDGTHRSEAQWSYTGHRKGVLDCHWIDSVRLVASTDGVVHLWDPLIGTKLREFEWVTDGGGVHLVAYTQGPSRHIVAASASYSSIKLIDCRVGKWCQEFRLGGAGGNVRGLAVDGTGEWVAVSRSNGQILVMDVRNGKMVAASSQEQESAPWVEHLVGNQFLCVQPGDQAMSIFNYKGELVKKLAGGSENVSCVVSCGQQILCATSSNKIYLHSDVTNRPLTSTVRLRSEVFVGSISCMTCLPLHNIVLLGSTHGHIQLLC